MSQATRRKATAFGILFLLVACAAFFFTKQKSLLSAKVKPTVDVETEAAAPIMMYGIEADDLDASVGTIQKDEFLSDILTRHNVDYLKIDALARKAKDVFDVRNLQVKKRYCVLSEWQDSMYVGKYFVYDPTPYFYVVYDLTDTISIRKVERPIEVVKKSASGVITSSLWNALVDNGINYELAVKMEDAFAWSIDFHHIQPNDRFKGYYDEHRINGEVVGVGELYAAQFMNYGNEYNAFKFNAGTYDGFYDEEARPMEKAFLKAPVKYTRISSRYSKRRFHPVLKRNKAHLGTDYAAPTGTPIYAVANGVVTHASYSRGNGNYVKIKHDKTYTTQYLHMSKFAQGMKAGVHVKQGEVIGYVGSTGLATGPHVCFRFWKNGKQVDHLREKLPPPEPMPEDMVPKFNIVRDSFQVILDQIEYQEDRTVALEMVTEGKDSIP